VPFLICPTSASLTVQSDLTNAYPDPVVGRRGHLYPRLVAPMSSYTTGMSMDNVSRRSLLKAARSMGMMAGLPETALAFQTPGQVRHEVASGPLQEHAPGHTIKFAVVGLDHNHINGITDTIRRCGGSCR
jgi:hypothetical protein